MRNSKQLLILISLLSVMLLTSPSKAAATPLGGGSCSGEEVYTAIGCVSITSGDSLAEFVLRWGIGVAGGIALLLIVSAGIQIMVAGGDPKKVQAGKELLTAAIGGFLFLLFSSFILEFVGVDILGLNL